MRPTRFESGPVPLPEKVSTMTPQRTTHPLHDKDCPTCTETGIVRDLTVGRGLVRMALGCPTCGRGWTVHRGVAVPDWKAQVSARD